MLQINFSATRVYSPGHHSHDGVRVLWSAIDLENRHIVSGGEVRILRSFFESRKSWGVSDEAQVFIYILHLCALEVAPEISAKRIFLVEE